MLHALKWSYNIRPDLDVRYTSQQHVTFNIILIINDIETHSKQVRYFSWDICFNFYSDTTANIDVQLYFICINNTELQLLVNNLTILNSFSIKVLQANANTNAGCKQLQLPTVLVGAH